MTCEINGFQLYQAFLAGYFEMKKNREKMNRINVFPVRDGDTGSNMVSTMKNVATGLKSCRSAGKLLERIAELSLEGARGNSGMILTQYLNGMARHGRGKSTLSLCELADIINLAVKDAYKAVDVPREGTILSVMTAWAEKFHSLCGQHRSPQALMEVSLERAREALEHTPEQLDILKENRVVDAGALGFVSFLEGVDKLGDTGLVDGSMRKEILTDSDRSTLSYGRGEGHGGSGKFTFRYCTEVLLEKSEGDRDELRAILSPLGDSLIVAEGIDKFRIHIHTDEPDRVVDTLRRLGRVIQQKADDMKRQEQVVSARAGRIAVLTDSIADIPRELMDRYQIHRLSLSLIWDDEEYLDRLTIRPDTFYAMQEERASFPASSLPSASRVENYFAFLLEHYEGVIVLSVSKELSGTWKQMSLAAEKFNRRETRIAVVDTRLNSVAQGLLVERVARVAVQGAGLEELILLAESLRKRIKIFVSVKTFRYMVKGGRVTPLKGAAAKLLNLKPIITLDEEGKGKAFDKSFSSGGLMKKVTALVRDIHGGKGIEEYAVVHASDRERGETFSRLVGEVIGKEPSYISEISPIVGMHSGKGAVAIGIIERDD